ncbi:MAG: NAD-dependent epimerase/dehydratase family protein [Armatimonadetes bacterium]|nr:NAD-dependent epimerase/dehydratase family protein [Armatimonadota bacterium]
MKKVLITGGAGFIGSHLADYLIEHGSEVWVVDDLSTGSLDNLRPHPRLHVVIDSVTNEAVMNELIHRVDHVYHLAAVVGVRLVVDSPVRTLEVNLRGTEVVLKLAHRFGKRVLLASTSEVYGRQHENRPLSEDSERIYGPTVVGRWSYAAAKAIDEFLGLAYHRERGLEVVITRFFNTVGPRQTGRYGMVIPRFVEAAINGKPIEVHGHGRQCRSFTYVGDAVRAITRLMASRDAVGEVINIGNGAETTIIDLARRVKELTSSDSEIRFISYEEAYGAGFEDMMFRTPCTRKLQQFAGFTPSVPLDEILRQVIEDRRMRNLSPALLEAAS